MTTFWLLTRNSIEKEKNWENCTKCEETLMSSDDDGVIGCDEINQTQMKLNHGYYFEKWYLLAGPFHLHFDTNSSERLLFVFLSLPLLIVNGFCGFHSRCLEWMDFYWNFMHFLDLWSYYSFNIPKSTLIQKRKSFLLRRQWQAIFAFYSFILLSKFFGSLSVRTMQTYHNNGMRKMH